MKFRLAVFFLILTFHSFIGVFTSILLPRIAVASRYVFVMADLVILALAVTVLWRRRTFQGAIAFTVIVIGAVLTSIYNSGHGSLVATLNGMRDPLFFLSCLIIAFDFLQSDLRDRFVSLFTWFLLFFAIVQIPLSFWQFVQFGSGDYVGGTYGRGGSGYLTQVLLLVAFYLIVQKGSLEGGQLFNIRKVFTYSFLLIPCALNETKISIVLIPLYFSLIAFSGTKVYRAIPIVVLSLLLGLFWEYFYRENVQDTSRIFDLQFVERYMYSGSDDSDMPRLARIPAMFRIMRGDIGLISLGLGYGLFGGANVLGMTQIGKSLSFLAGSKTLLFTVWIQGGLLAVLAIGYAMNFFMWSRQQMYHTLRRFKWFLFFSMMLVWVYNDAVFDRGFGLIVTYLMVWIYVGGDGEELAASDDEAGDGTDVQAEAL